MNLETIDASVVFGSADHDGCAKRGSDRLSPRNPHMMCRFYRQQVGNTPICALAFLREISRQTKKGMIAKDSQVMDTNQFYPMSTTVENFAAELSQGDSESNLGPGDAKRCYQGASGDGLRVAQMYLGEIKSTKAKGPWSQK